MTRRKGKNEEFALPPQFLPRFLFLSPGSYVSVDRRVDGAEKGERSIDNPLAGT